MKVFFEKTWIWWWTAIIVVAHPNAMPRQDPPMLRDRVPQCPPLLCDGLAGTASSTKSNLPRQLPPIRIICIGATGLFPIAMRWFILCNLLNSIQLYQLFSFSPSSSSASSIAIYIYSRYGTITFSWIQSHFTPTQRLPCLNFNWSCLCFLFQS